MTGRYKSKKVNKLTNNKGEIIINKQNIKETWKNYIEQLFHDVRPEKPNIVDEFGPPILVEEVKSAIYSMKSGKAPGPDGIQVEFLKLFDEMSMKWLTEIFDHVYNSSIIPPGVV